MRTASNPGAGPSSPASRQPARSAMRGSAFMRATMSGAARRRSPRWTTATERATSAGVDRRDRREDDTDGSRDGGWREHPARQDRERRDGGGAGVARQPDRREQAHRHRDRPGRDRREQLAGDGRSRAVADAARAESADCGGVEQRLEVDDCRSGRYPDRGRDIPVGRDSSTPWRRNKGSGQRTRVRRRREIEPKFPLGNERGRGFRELVSRPTMGDPAPTAELAVTVAPSAKTGAREVRRNARSPAHPASACVSRWSRSAGTRRCGSARRFAAPLGITPLCRRPSCRIAGRACSRW